MTSLHTRRELLWIARWRDEQGDTTALGLARIALGTLLLEQAIVSPRELAAYGQFGDGIHIPLLPEALGPSRTSGCRRHHRAWRSRSVVWRAPCWACTSHYAIAADCTTGDSPFATASAG